MNSNIQLKLTVEPMTLSYNVQSSQLAKRCDKLKPLIEKVMENQTKDAAVIEIPLLNKEFCDRTGTQPVKVGKIAIEYLATGNMRKGIDKYHLPAYLVANQFELKDKIPDCRQAIKSFVVNDVWHDPAKVNRVLEAAMVYFDTQLLHWTFNVLVRNFSYNQLEKMLCEKNSSWERDGIIDLAKRLVNLTFIECMKQDLKMGDGKAVIEESNRLDLSILEVEKIINKKLELPSHFISLTLDPNFCEGFSLTTAIPDDESWFILLGDRIRRINVKGLDFKNSSLSAEKINRLEKILSHEDTSVSAINFSEIPFNKELSEALFHLLSQNKSLEKIEMHNCKLSDELFIGFVNGINTKNLKILNLQCNQLGKNSSQELLSLVQQAQSITRLELKTNNLDTSFFKQLSDIIKNHEELTYLDLGFNKPGPEGLSALFLNLSLNSKIKTLCLRGNEMEQVQFLDLISMLQSNFALEKLDLGKNNLTDESARSLQSLFKLSNNKLKTIILDENKFTTLGGKQIAQSFSNLKLKLEQLNVEGYSFPEEIVTQIKDAAKNKVNVLNL